MSYIKHPATCSKFEYTVSAIYTCCGMLRTRKLVSAAADLLAGDGHLQFLWVCVCVSAKFGFDAVLGTRH
jgi:hypothetical protein